MLGLLSVRQQSAHAQGPSALLPTWQVPTSQSSILPATRVAAGGFFNGTGLVVTGGARSQTGPQSSPLAPASFFPQGALPPPPRPAHSHARRPSALGNLGPIPFSPPPSLTPPPLRLPTHTHAC